MVARRLPGIGRGIGVRGGEELRQRGFELGFLGRVGPRLRRRRGGLSVASGGGAGGTTRASWMTMASASMARALASTLLRQVMTPSDASGDQRQCADELSS